ncbi:MAG: hypothetical protein KF689_02605 [Gemmatimonadaceae bacterium]|nr:hypothetical protein [Gemmatimonadaceae bacterium]MCW5826828.1 hypothetical protein [Gemmatimonadaceae bacterium]
MRLRWFACALMVATAALAAPSAAEAQGQAVAPDSVSEIRLRDGTVLIGRVVSETETTIVVLTRSGARVEVPVAQIVSRRETVARAGGEVWPDDENGSRLFFSSTGRPVPKGEGYVSSYWLFFPFVGYGVTERFTIAAGTPVIPGAMGEIFYIAPKFTLYDAGDLSLSVGALSFFLTKEIAEGNAGILYGVGTYGSRDNAITLGAGWFYAATDDFSGTSNEPVFMLGGERRISRRVKLVTENWLAVNPGVSGMFSGGFRFIGDRLSADLGFAGMTGVESACCLPVINFVWNFGGQGAR